MFLSTTSPCQRIRLLSLFCRPFAAAVVCAGLLFGLSISAAEAAGGKQSYSYHGRSLPKRLGIRKMDRPSYAVGTTFLGHWGRPGRLTGGYSGYGRRSGNVSRDYSAHRGFGEHGGKRYARRARDSGSRGGHYDAYHGGPVSPSGKIRRYHAGKYDRANRGYKGRYVRNTSSGALIISLGSSNSKQTDELAASGVTPRIEGDCEAGGYCTVRLGPYLNSPKIITLNIQDADNRPR